MVDVQRVLSKVTEGFNPKSKEVLALTLGIFKKKGNLQVYQKYHKKGFKL